MNIKIQSVATAVMILLFSSCMKDDPAEVAVKFLNAVENEEYERARELSTEDTGKMINLLESLSEISDQNTKGVSTGKPEVISERIEGDIAYVEFRNTGDAETDVLELRRIDGKWYAHVTKESVSDKEMIDTETSYDSYPEPADSL
jgi:hypothetical protein